MQDAVLMHAREDPCPWCLCAVFDGHGEEGLRAAKSAAGLLPVQVASSTGPEGPLTCLTVARHPFASTSSFALEYHSGNKYKPSTTQLADCNRRLQACE